MRSPWPTKPAWAGEWPEGRAVIRDTLEWSIFVEIRELEDGRRVREGFCMARDRREEWTSVSGLVIRVLGIFAGGQSWGSLGWGFEFEFFGTGGEIFGIIFSPVWVSSLVVDLSRRWIVGGSWVVLSCG